MPLTTVVQGMLADNSVISTTISAENVRDFDIALSAIRMRHIKDYEIQTVHLSGNVITSRTIANSAVTTRHYAPSSIQNMHLSAASVTTSNIALSTVTLDRLNVDVHNSFRGTKIHIINQVNTIFSGTNFRMAHGAIVVNLLSTQTATLTLDDSNDPVPSNFHCWILNGSLQDLVIQGSSLKSLKYDERKLTLTNPPATNSIIIPGKYFGDGFQRVYAFLYVFVGPAPDGSGGFEDALYVIPYNTF